MAAYAGMGGEQDRGVSRMIIAKLSDVRSLPDRDRHMLRFYVAGGNREEARYRDAPEVREILSTVGYRAVERDAKKATK